MIITMLKKYYNVLVVAFVVIGVLCTSPMVYANSTSWNNVHAGVLGYDWATDWGYSLPEYVPGLDSHNVTVTYYTTVTNVTTATILTGGESVSVGDVLQFEKVAHDNTHISWFGVGRSEDSPFGHWMAGATRPSAACAAGDFVNNYVLSIGDSVAVYVPLSVNPPSFAISHTASNLTCNASGSLCTVTSSGPITSDLTFSATNGEFYYGYNPGSGCSYFSKPMSQCDSIVGSPLGPYLKCAPVSDYTLNVPPQTITYTFNVAGANTPPEVPSIAGPATGEPSTAYSFTMTATDLDGDTLRYGIDFDLDAVVDLWVPGAGHVSSGIQRSFSKTWATDSSYTFNVLAQDIEGANSGWASHTIVIATPAAPVVSLTAASPIPYNTKPTLVRTVSNATSCTGSTLPALHGTGWSGGIAPNNGSIQPMAITDSPTPTTYYISCTGPGGTVTRQTSVTVNPPIILAPIAPAIVGSADVSVGVSESYTITATDPNPEKIRYGVDWNLDSIVDDWVPASGYVNSGTPRSVTQTWMSSGAHNFKVLTENESGLQSAWTTKNVTAHFPEITFTVVDSLPLPSNTSATLSWSVAYATECSGSVGPASWKTLKSLLIDTEATENLLTDTSYTLTCKNAADISDAETVFVEVSPDLTFSATPTSIPWGNSVELTWSAENAVSCISSGDWAAGSKVSSSTETVSPTVSPASYILTCTSFSGEVITETKTITINPPSITKFEYTGTPGSITYNTAPWMDYVVTSASVCTPSDGTPGSGWRTLTLDAGSGLVNTNSVITTDKLYTLTCTNPATGPAASVSITVPVKLPQCSDGVDNDSDALVDFAGGDPGCINAVDDNEVEPLCMNTLDDESDGYTDETDPGCWTVAGDSSSYNRLLNSENNCGNGVCETDHGESMGSCSVDCSFSWHEN